METHIEFIKRKNYEFNKSPLISLKDIGKSGKFIFKKEKWTFLLQHNIKSKIFLIERLKLKKIDIFLNNSNHYL